MHAEDEGAFRRGDGRRRLRRAGRHDQGQGQEERHRLTDATVHRRTSSLGLGPKDITGEGSWRSPGNSRDSSLRHMSPGSPGFVPGPRRPLVFFLAFRAEKLIK
ncbi:MAG: hypothetical protein MZV64_43810 [Ignavibacteriales bacterium]|nr:hypothetical protein [Ignavibacteriales bacterium]